MVKRCTIFHETWCVPIVCATLTLALLSSPLAMFQVVESRRRLRNCFHINSILAWMQPRFSAYDVSTSQHRSESGLCVLRSATTRGWKVELIPSLMMT
ncbi:hypothetical protein PLICRDRAFT_450518 [Plicaturopsis crispa FD-325 SS-3]|uniref:Uncharacterized protein n=1 Tax=Plicaturopsis crispa FD-325 SS-3 TaxID=944288 RepID=A0A0C9T274_PLICR|nr:hypothetical protein PLICRDRAFT_450518 [Plicaturopsis crispa FD-325 SS-3]